MSDPRHGLGVAGERLAAHFLSSHGLTITDMNVTVPGGEIDLLAVDGRLRVVVEVRTVSGGDDPLDAVDDAKRRKVARLAGRIGADRVDFVGIRLDADGLDVHWVPGSN